MICLAASDISLSLNGSPILKNINIELNKGEILGLIGPNGAGKSTALRVMAGLQHADTGSVSFEGEALTSYSKNELARHIAYLAQSADSHWPLKVERIVALGRLPFQTPFGGLSEQDDRAIQNALIATEIEHLSDRVINTLSGGERARVFLARILASQPRIILADEPITALDPYHQLHVMELLQRSTQQGGSVVVVIHDLNMASRFCHRLALIDNGELIAEGKPDDVLNDQNLDEVYGINVRRSYQGSALSLIPYQRTRNHQ